MAVTINHYANSSGFGLQIQPSQIVQHVDPDSLNLDDFSFGQPRRPRAAIHVAAHGGYGGEFAQAIENSWIAYVSSMQDAVDAVQNGDGLGPQQAVGIGDDPDCHAFLAR